MSLPELLSIYVDNPRAYLKGNNAIRTYEDFSSLKKSAWKTRAKKSIEHFKTEHRLQKQQFFCGELVNELNTSFMQFLLVLRQDPFAADIVAKQAANQQHFKTACPSTSMENQVETLENLLWDAQVLALFSSPMDDLK